MIIWIESSHHCNQSIFSLKCKSESKQNFNRIFFQWTHKRLSNPIQLYLNIGEVKKNSVFQVLRVDEYGK